jgi:hypothetical protein
LKGIIKQLNERADWSGEMKSIPLLRTIPLKNWIVIFPNAKRGTAYQFLQVFSDLMGGMSVEADRPKELNLQIFQNITHLILNKQ